MLKNFTSIPQQVGNNLLEYYSHIPSITFYEATLTLVTWNKVTALAFSKNTFQGPFVYSLVLKADQ